MEQNRECKGRALVGYRLGKFARERLTRPRFSGFRFRRSFTEVDDSPYGLSRALSTARRKYFAFYFGVSRGAPPPSHFGGDAGARRAGCFAFFFGAAATRIFIPSASRLRISPGSRSSASQSERNEKTVRDRSRKNHRSASAASSGSFAS